MWLNDLICDLAPPCSQQLCNTIGTIVTIALTVSGLGLLTTGLICTNTGKWVSDKGDCLNIYIAGILMTFIMSILWLFAVLFWLLEHCDKPATATATATVSNPVIMVQARRRDSRDSRDSKDSKDSKDSPKLSAKKKNSPLQVLVS